LFVIFISPRGEFNFCFGLLLLKRNIYVCLQLVEGYFGVAQDDKPTPEQWFENARGVAGAMEGSVTS
jgi:hypothetical protein